MGHHADLSVELIVGKGFALGDTHHVRFVQAVLPGFDATVAILIEQPECLVELVAQALGALRHRALVNDGLADLVQVPVHLAQHFIHPLELPGMGIAGGLPDHAR